VEGVVDLELRGAQDHHDRQACVPVSPTRDSTFLNPLTLPPASPRALLLFLRPPLSLSPFAHPLHLSAASTTTTTSQWVAPKTTTTQAPKTTQQASSASSGTYSGQATFYSQGGAAGSCGNYASDSDYVVAVNAAQMNSGWCGRTVKVTNTANGATITAKVADTCPGCSYGSLDLSTGGASPSPPSRALEPVPVPDSLFLLQLSAPSVTTTPVCCLSPGTLSEGEDERATLRAAEEQET